MLETAFDAELLLFSHLSGHFVLARDLLVEGDMD